MTLEPEWTPLLRKIPFLAEFSEEERALLFPTLQRIKLETGDRLFQQGEPGDALHLLISGEISLVQHRDGKEHVLATFSRRGDLLGEWALLGGEMRPGTATALQPTILLTLKRVDFERVLQQHPPLAIAVARSLARRLMESAHPIAKARAREKYSL